MTSPNQVLLKLLGVLLITISAFAYGGQPKIDICHITGVVDLGDGDVPIGHLINISESAYPAHMKHGDPEFWDVVFLTDGSMVCLDEEHIIGDKKNNYDYGDPYKQGRPHVSDTFTVQFNVVGDMQLDTEYFEEAYFQRTRRVVKSIRRKCGSDDVNCIGIVAVGDLTQHSCSQEVIAYRQMFEDSYPGSDGGAIDNADDDDTEYFSDGFIVTKPVFSGIGNHDDPTEQHETCDWDCSCGTRADRVCHSPFVKDYIRKRIEGSSSLYEASKLLNTDGQNYYRHGDGDIYAWEWGSYHFIHTNMWAGYGGHVSGDDGPSGPTKFSKLNQLKEHLEMNIGDSGKPVLLFQHFGWTNWNFDYNDNGWWTTDNAHDLINVLCRRTAWTDPCNPYNVLGIFSGHDHKTGKKNVNAGADENGNDVVFANYIVNDAGPGTNGSTGYFSVHLDYDPASAGKGHMKVYEYITDKDITDDNKDDDDKYTHNDTAPPTLYREKDIDLAFIDWEQGEPDNGGGTESCAAVGRKGRFADFDCNENRHLLCRIRSSGALYITNSLHGWGEAKLICDTVAADFVGLNSVEEQREFMDKFIADGMEHWVWVNNRSPWVLRKDIASGAIGDSNDDTEGAGIAMADIDGNGMEDLIELHIWDKNNNNSAQNYAHYSIGWNPGSTDSGKPTSWSGRYNIGAGVGWRNQGGGIAAGFINDNEIIDLVVFYIDNPDGVNTGYYRIGWDVNTDGTIDNWSDSIEVPNLQQGDHYFFTNASAGGGVALKDITGNGIPELVFYNIASSPDAYNYDRYLIGWDINSSSGSPTHWNFPGIIDVTSQENHGGGISTGDIDDNGQLDLITYFITGIEGANHAYYRIGWNLDNVGRATSWSRYRAATDVGDITRFAGIAVGNIDGNDRPDLILASVMGSLPNYFRYAVARNISTEGKLVTQHLDENGTLVGPSYPY
jgi:cytolysin (calcineurin-like family phosphatase)